jgi:hypothetical protein
MQTDKLCRRADMKDKIKKLSKGIFEYELPSIVLSEKRIIHEIEAGKVFKGRFLIKNSAMKEMRGVIYSSNSFMNLVTPSFTGIENYIEYEFYANNIHYGERIYGVFNIVSSCGDMELPYEFFIEAPYLMTSVGKIKEFSEFTILAKEDFTQAVKIFKSEKFQEVFLRKDERNSLIYKSLMKGISKYFALEEFLIGLHEKTQINLTTSQTNYEYQNVELAFMDKILLSKDNWGFCQVQVSTDAPFIEIDNTLFSTENFTGNHYDLEFVMNPAYMRSGKNHATIYIKTVNQIIIIEIMATCYKENHVRDLNRAIKKGYLLSLQKNYMNFRTGIIDLAVYVSNTEALLNNHLFQEQLNQIRIDLLKTHLYIIDGMDQLAMDHIVQFQEKEQQLKENSIFDYCAYLYLRVLFNKASTDSEKLITEIRYYYDHGYDNWEILWYLLYLDKRYHNKQLKLKDIQSQLEKGCHSPILYYEACCVYNEEPSLLQQLDSITIQVMNWGMKADYISKEVAVQYTYLTGREKKFNHLVFAGLVHFYEKIYSKDVLTAICSMLIKGQKVDNKYFYWYSRGIQEQLRLTELYENYMYALDDKLMPLLPKTILLYFQYNSSLSDKKKAYLYANIIKNKDKEPSVFQNYRKQMERFAYNQMKHHNINKHLAIIYEEILKKDTLEEKLAKDLPYVMFRYELMCENTNIVGVLVVHKELEEEVYVPLISGRAQISIFTKNPVLIFVDSNHNRYATTIGYTLNKLLKLDHYSKKCYELNHNSHMLVLNLFDAIELVQKENEEEISIRKRLLSLPSIREYYRNNCLLTLIQVYYNNGENNKLEELLLKIELHEITGEQRNKVIGKMIERGLYEKAFEGLKEYGFKGVYVKGLAKLATRLIVNLKKEEKNDFLIKMGYYIFLSGEGNDTILKYLAQYFLGPIEEMYQLWKVAVDREVVTTQLEEGILVQSLFTEHSLEDEFLVFQSYYRKKNRDVLIRGFLSYNGYKYLMDARKPDFEFFEIIKKELKHEENETCMLALLKYYSEKTNLDVEELDFVDFNLHNFIQQGLVLPYFKKFQNLLKLPQKISNKYYVQHICDPSAIVKIHYIIEDETKSEKVITEVMRNVYKGIHMKEFILFSNETLQYYITQVNDSKEKITESFRVTSENIVGQEDSSFVLLNKILKARENNNEEVLIELMKNYVELDYINSKVFRAN